MFSVVRSECADEGFPPILGLAAIQLVVQADMVNEVEHETYGHELPCCEPRIDSGPDFSGHPSRVNQLSHHVDLRREVLHDSRPDIGV